MREYKTLSDIIEDLDEIAVIDIRENGIGHCYFCDEIQEIDEDLLGMEIVSWFIVSKTYGYEVSVEL